MKEVDGRREGEEKRHKSHGLYDLIKKKLEGVRTSRDGSK